MNFKAIAVAYVKNALQDKKITLQKHIKQLSDDAQNDAKSSAGDKHETALSMMQLEQEKLNQKLKETLQTIETFEKIDFISFKNTITLGTLVTTNDCCFLLSIAHPQTIIAHKTTFFLSPQSPLGQAMLFKKAGDEIKFNQFSHKIVEIT
jgi:transcription elongation GreA/GreB family factor